MAGINHPDIFLILVMCFLLVCVELSLLFNDKSINVKYVPVNLTIRLDDSTHSLQHLYHTARMGEYQKPYIDTPQWRMALNKTKYQNDPDCTNINKVPKGSMKQRLLYSSQGSGSTWLRYLLELASGFHTGSHYRDNDDYVAGFIGEAMDPLERRTLLVKSRGPNVTRALPGAVFEGALILLRNPFQSILSSYYKEQFDDVGYIDHELFHTREWIDFATLESRKWYVGARLTCLTVRPSITVLYEDLVNDTEAEMQRILTFLDIKASSERIKCALSHSGRVFRKYELGPAGRLDMDPYTEELKSVINQRIQMLRGYLQREMCGSVPQYEREDQPLNLSKEG